MIGVFYPSDAVDGAWCQESVHALLVHVEASHIARTTVLLKYETCMGNYTNIL
jgi:hypothetical protein